MINKILNAFIAMQQRKRKKLEDAYAKAWSNDRFSERCKILNRIAKKIIACNKKINFVEQMFM